jgi:hypothetical protein
MQTAKIKSVAGAKPSEKWTNRRSTESLFIHMQMVDLAYLSTELVAFRCANECDVYSRNWHDACDVV